MAVAVCTVYINLHVCSAGECLPTQHGYMHLTSDNKAPMQADYGAEKGQTPSLISGQRGYIFLGLSVRWFVCK